MEKEFIPYEQALALKELGFDEPCLAWYGSKDMFEISGRYKNSTHTVGYCVSAPTFSQAFRWFREKYDLTFYVEKPYHHNSNWRYVIDVNENEWLDESFKNYEEAEFACLKKLIEIVKNK